VTATLVGLLEESRQLGFLGPGPIDVHIDHARAFAVAAGLDRDPVRALDLGAGGGLPGLVLAYSTWPTTRWVFLDGMERRTAFLRRAVADLGLEDRVEVVTERAETYGRRIDARGAFDLVVARSFGPPAAVAECAAPLLGPGGLLVVSEPPHGSTEDRWPADGLALLGLGAAEPVEVDGGPEAVHLVRIRSDRPCGDRHPRRVGIPAKRPLF
jgi:16S rRNA (guanine527-N7)-methyltransferase